MDVLRRYDVTMTTRNKPLTTQPTPRRLPSLKHQARTNNQMSSTYPMTAPQMPFNPPIGGNFSIGGTSMMLPHIGSPDPMMEEDRSSIKRRQPPMTKSSWHPSEERQRDEKEMNPEPMPFMASVFNGPGPLERVRVQGVPFPSLSTSSDLKSDTLSMKSKSVRSIPSPTPSENKSQNQQTSMSDSPTLKPLRFEDKRSSTVMRRIITRQRHTEMWGAPESSATQQGFAFAHTDRYQTIPADDYPPYEEHRVNRGSRESSQSTEFNDRVTYMRTIRQRRLKLYEQEPMNMQMGGKQVMMFERMDVADELRKLKSISLPKKAKDLYVGRGFKMPDNHAVNKPRPVRTKTTPNEGGRVTHIIQPDFKSKTEFMANESWSKTEVLDNRMEHEKESVTPRLPHVEVNSSRVVINSAPRAPSPSLKSAYSAHPKAPTPNPLKTGLVENFVESTEYEKLRKTFKRLDTDMDGHVMFNQLKTVLPKGLSHPQERFIKQVYDIASSNTFFGMNEYISMSIMCHRIASLEGQARDAFNKINFATLENTIKQYADLFQAVDRSNSGKVSSDSLRQILNMALDDRLTEETFIIITDTMKITNDGVNKMDFIAYIPFFMLFDTLEVPAASISVHGD